MKYILYTISILLAGISWCSCSDDKGPAPTPIQSLQSFPGPGYIDLEWDVPVDSGYHHVRVAYYDPRKKQDCVRLASVYSRTMRVTDTRAKYGNYTFEVQTVTESGRRGELQQTSATSGPAPKTKTWISTVGEIALTVGQLSSNAADPDEGQLEHLIDGNTETFFHTDWHSSPPYPHDITIDLGKSVQGFIIEYVNRNSPWTTANRPKVADILISSDNENWELVTTFTDLPDQALDKFTSPAIIVPGDILPRYVRFSVTDVTEGGPSYCLGEMKVYEGNVEVIDPEDPNTDH